MARGPGRAKVCALYPGPPGDSLPLSRVGHCGQRVLGRVRRSLSRNSVIWPGLPALARVMGSKSKGLIMKRTIRAQTGGRDVLVHVVGQWYAVHGSRTVNFTRDVIGGNLDTITDDRTFTAPRPIVSPDVLYKATLNIKLGSL